MTQQEQNDLEHCQLLARRGYRPHAVQDGKEIISYPFPENGNIFIMARTTPGDPTTMKKFQIVLARLVEVRNA